MTLFFLAFFVIKKDKFIRHKKIDKFPFKKPFIALSLSLFASALFGIAGFSKEVSAFIGSVSQLLLVWLMWILVDEERDIKSLVKWFSILFLAYALYMFYEISMQSNPLVEYETTLISADRTLDFRYSIDEYRGYRAQSVFEHAIGAGINFAMYGMLTFSVLFSYKIRMHSKKILVLIATLCSACAFLTASRGPIVFLLLSYLAFVNLKNLRTWGGLLVAVAIFIAILPYLPETVVNITYSIFDSQYQQKVGGSDADMRMEQLEAAIAVMQKSPLVGLGSKFQQVMDNSLTSMLLGMESMWFRILTCNGLLGVVANLYAAFFFLITIPKRYHSRNAFFLSLAYWVTASLTSVPGMLMYLYYLILIVFIKIPSISARSNKVLTEQ